jgi:hypothetical protein
MELRDAAVNPRVSPPITCCRPAYLPSGLRQQAPFFPYHDQLYSEVRAAELYF